MQDFKDQLTQEIAAFNEELPTPLDFASVYRISPMICMVFTPLYRRMAFRYSRDCHGVF